MILTIVCPHCTTPPLSHSEYCAHTPSLSHTHNTKAHLIQCLVRQSATFWQPGFDPGEKNMSKNLRGGCRPQCGPRRVHCGLVSSGNTPCDPTVKVGHGKNRTVGRNSRWVTYHKIPVDHPPPPETTRELRPTVRLTISDFHTYILRSAR